MEDANEDTPGNNGAAAPMSEDDDDGEMAAIQDIFRRKLIGLRRLPRPARAAALRVARDWLALAMKDVREKRIYKRHALAVLRRQRRRFQYPSLGGP
jgi:hypothetical protein